ncbi:DNA-binding response regulator [Chitinophaga lutea]|uniref:DNA-binding response regulator n=1 Tax=Chitinophaga lutea TaxID=2488634 RepID=A0A3N4Q6L5_9BACT|nr:LytTR family DNA-binding domain-containing protein [Chitinophaga lutea]RPE13171.1 DNA-binding response regulator [Chitinophaga lutea]
MRHPIRVVIVDDEPAITHTLSTFLAGHPDFYVVASCATVQDALIVIPATEPDLLLLDIAFPDGTAWDILRPLLPLSFRVIFITAFHEHAIKAIKVGALDYILKPVDELELSAALQKAQIDPPPAAQQITMATRHNGHTAPAQLLLRENHIYHLVNVADIMYLDATSGGLLLFHLQDGRQIPVHKTIRDYEDLLPAADFFRPHQSYLVNRRHVTQYHSAGHLILKNTHRVPVSVRKQDHIRDYLNG